MAKIRPWAVWRRSLYGSALILVLTVFGTTAFFLYGYQPADCFDNERNGSERDVDCGGACVRICTADVSQPRLVWVESFLITTGQYNTVAYIENTNQFAATPELNYVLELLDGETVVAARTGTAILPPNSIYPIFEGRIETENDRKVTETRLTLKPVTLWQPATVGRDQFRTRDIDLRDADARPRLTVSVENTELTPAKNVEFVATIFNEAGQPVTASQTYVETMDGRSTEEMVFTWPNSIAKTVKNCIIPTDVAVAIDLSGSMNNDGGTPPQPVTDALSAASTFISTLKERDQVGLITYASAASAVSELTRERALVAGTVRALTISPTEETGFTNTAAALQTSAIVLNSDLHNSDARRVLVLLTDGLPTAPGDTDVTAEAITAANALKAEGIDIYAIGLGEGVNREFISAIASTNQQAFIAPTGEDLTSIYNTITSSLCESGPTKIDVFAKTTTNFTPLR